jgi:hypothetical protein
MKAPNVPTLQAAIDNKCAHAGGELQQRGGAGGSMPVIGAMPVKKAPNAPALQAAIDNAGGELQRGGAGGSMSVIAAMSVKKYVPGSVQGVLPVKGDFIEALWTEDGKVKGWFAAEVLLGDVSQIQARNEKRGERYMRCHRIQYQHTDKTLEWALLCSWPDRATRAARKTGESKSAKWKAKYEAELEVVQWRYPAL